MSLLSEPDKVALEAKIKKIIFEADLHKITVKGIRHQLEQEDSIDRSGEKTFFLETIKKCLFQRENDLNSKGKNIVPISITKYSGDYNMALQLQQEERLSNHVVLRRRASGINKKYQEGFIIESLKSKNKCDKNEKKPPNNSTKRVLNKPLLLSTELGAVFENKYIELTRPEVVKKLWNYIKDHNLQDPKDKRFILCDDLLMQVFNRSRLNCFKMAKFLTTHLHRKEDLSDVSIKQKKIDNLKIQAKLSEKKINAVKQNIIIIKESGNIKSDCFPEEFKSNEIHPLLLQIPGVISGMSYSAVQAAILSYTQLMKLRLPSDNDLIIVQSKSPIAKLMGKNSTGTIHILDLIQRVHTLFDQKAS